jgi:hypothetical protein
VAAVAKGRTAVVVLTEQFEALTAIMAENAGRSGLRRLVLPFPFETKPESEVRQIARDNVARLLRTLGVTDAGIQ